MGLQTILDTVGAPAESPEADTPDRGRAVARVPEDWGQGRSSLGGLIAALAVRALRPGLVERPLRSLLVSFVGPVSPGEVEIATSTVRQGGSMSQLEARLSQDGSVRCVTLAAAGARRGSQIVVPPLPRPDAPPPEDCGELPYVEGVYPAFTQHFAYRWTHGATPFSGRPGHEIAGWCRFRDAPEPPSAEHVLTLLDAWPAPVLGQLSSPAPASSVTWGVDLVALDREAACEEWWFYRSVADAAGDGYVQARAALWDPRGRLVALGRQTIAVFA